MDTTRVKPVGRGLGFGVSSVFSNSSLRRLRVLFALAFAFQPKERTPVLPSGDGNASFFCVNAKYACVVQARETAAREGQGEGRGSACHGSGETRREKDEARRCR